MLTHFSFSSLSLTHTHARWLHVGEWEWERVCVLSFLFCVHGWTLTIICATQKQIKVKGERVFFGRVYLFFFGVLKKKKRKRPISETERQSENEIGRRGLVWATAEAMEMPISWNDDMNAKGPGADQRTLIHSFIHLSRLIWNGSQTGIEIHTFVLSHSLISAYLVRIHGATNKSMTPNDMASPTT